MVFKSEVPSLLQAAIGTQLSSIPSLYEGSEEGMQPGQPYSSRQNLPSYR